MFGGNLIESENRSALREFGATIVLDSSAGAPLGDNFLALFLFCADSAYYKGTSCAGSPSETYKGRDVVDVKMCLAPLIPCLATLTTVQHSLHMTPLLDAPPHFSFR